MHLGRIKNTSEGNSRENHYTFNQLCRLDIFFYPHTQLFSWCMVQKSAFESDCLRLFLPTWKLAQIRGKFSLQAKGMPHEQINIQNRTLQKTLLHHPTKHDASALKFSLKLNLSCHMCNLKAALRTRPPVKAKNPLCYDIFIFAGILDRWRRTSATLCGKCYTQWR